jgi:hypothetical protein
VGRIPAAFFDILVDSEEPSAAAMRSLGSADLTRDLLRPRALAKNTWSEFKLTPGTLVMRDRFDHSHSLGELKSRVTVQALFWFALRCLGFHLFCVADVRSSILSKAG